MRLSRRTFLGATGAVAGWIAARRGAATINGFVQLTGHPPTHVDSHHHVHREFNIAYLFLEVSRH